MPLRLAENCWMSCVKSHERVTNSSPRSRKATSPKRGALLPGNCSMRCAMLPRGLDLVDLVAHAARGVQQEHQVDAHRAAVVLQPGQRDHLLRPARLDCGLHARLPARDDGAELGGLGLARRRREEEHAPVAHRAAVEHLPVAVEQLHPAPATGCCELSSTRTKSRCDTSTGMTPSPL